MERSAAQFVDRPGGPLPPSPCRRLDEREQRVGRQAGVLLARHAITRVELLAVRPYSDERIARCRQLENHSLAFKSWAAFLDPQAGDVLGMHISAPNGALVAVTPRWRRSRSSHRGPGA
jgi:hypothetical protein